MTTAALLVGGGLIAQPAAANGSDILPSVPQVLQPGVASGTDQFIIGVKDASAQALDAAVNVVEDAADRAAGKLGVNAKSVRENATGGHVVKLDEALSAAEAEEFAQSLRSDPDVAYAEPDAVMHALVAPNDSYFDEQWNLWDSPASLRTTGAWDYTHGEGVVVAVVDSGITRHPDLDANILPGYDMIADAADARDGDGRDADPTDAGDWAAANECADGSPKEDSSWHGTHVAGIIAAVGNNSRGISGVAPASKILPVRALSVCGGYTSDIADSIIWAAGGTVSGVPANPNPAKVINLSLGGTMACSATYQNAIDFAHNAGSVVVTAAGNSNSRAVDVSPANCRNVITVGSSTKTGARAYYSNYGDVVDVSAPGGDMTSDPVNGVLSAFNAGSTTQGQPAYAFMQGTSMAAGHVSGLAALLFAAEGTSLSPDALEQQLKDTARPFPAGCAKGCGAGMVDATAALVAYGGNLPVAPSPVVFDDQDGTARDTYQILPVTGAEYMVNGAVVEPGIYPGVGTVTVTARAAEGYVLAVGAATEWAYTFKVNRSKITDFNGDGKPDVLVRDTAGALWLYPGNGSGGWLAARQIGSGWNVMTAIEAPGDFNGDGKADVIARDSKGTLWLYPGNGSGGWLAARQIGSGWNVMSAIEAPGDFNGDGKADVIARDGNGVLWLYPGNGSGGWLAAKQIGWGWNVMTAIDGPGDFNGDGNADVLARNSSGGLLLYPGNGAGGWLPAKQIGWGWDVMTAIEGPGDFNGDGQMDVLARNASGNLFLYEGYGSNGFFRSYQVGSGWNIMNAIL
ncbi:S8 family serine peptidase [Paenarthrobacter ureafaciens]|uniref:S8 family serine peptidase n=1 Tax=Paenarthrobacter ureafaciens TaxID=37931 RepID=UPI001FB52D4B|nr:S8 family serine peptidase [Paenarthrobacter ureafaciens]UOD80466.1 S8 family serine peptidase [Paenarthrobacter ureafaciens]WNZ03117.1 S8 family serine peptidase [Paenarthrobacter ureafaciens]